jgi:thiamine-phosphate pyrophosphorylase
MSARQGGTDARGRADVRVYVIVDPAACAGRDPLRVAEAAARGGATLIQLRDKSGNIPDMLKLARAMKPVLAGHDVPLVVNDRVDVALAAQLDGAHVGQEDLPAVEARRLLGADAIIGLSHQTAEHIKASPLEALSYVAIGGIFATASKKQPRAPIGPKGLRALAQQVRARAADMPIVAIAGIKAGNAAEVIAAAADGVSVISEVCAADDPEQAARQLRAVVDAALRERGERRRKAT